jgi:hypothetical protein
MEVAILERFPRSCLIRSFANRQNKTASQSLLVCCSSNTGLDFLSIVQKKPLLPVFLKQKETSANCFSQNIHAFGDIND